MAIEIVKPNDIEKRSFAIITEELAQKGLTVPEREAPVTKRVIHTSADFEYAETMTYSENAIDIMQDLIRNGADIVTDTNEKFGGRVHCFMADPDVAKEAKERGITRATVCMEKAARISKEENKPMIFAIGNAPTALIRLREMYDEGSFKPAFIVGVPVGFVNVVEGKELIRSA